MIETSFCSAGKSELLAAGVCGGVALVSCVAEPRLKYAEMQCGARSRTREVAACAGPSKTCGRSRRWRFSNLPADADLRERSRVFQPRRTSVANLTITIFAW